MSQLMPFLTDEELPPSRNQQSPARRIALLLAGVMAATAFGTFVALARSIGATDQPAAASESRTVSVVVAQGDALSEIAVKLRDAGVVSTAQSFVLAAESDARSQGIGPGTYSLRTGMTGPEALSLMLDPSSRTVMTLVIPEGLTLDETVSAAVEVTGLPRANFDAVLEDPDLLERLGLPEWADGTADGFLFPATYELGPDATARSVIGTMIRRFNDTATDINLVRRAEKAGMDPYDVVTIASLAEAEVVPDDFGRVARVVLNRLASGMPLQLDSTVNFALGTRDILLSDKQLEVDSPYNTYVNDGLPPTPINSPGQEALESALDPEPGDWYYFVAVDPENGVTEFTSSYDRFLELKQEFRDRVADDR